MPKLGHKIYKQGYGLAKNGHGIAEIVSLKSNLFQLLFRKFILMVTHGL